MMDVTVKETKERVAKTLKLHLKVCDQFTAQLLDDNGKAIIDDYDDYVPAFMPGEHYGDYVILDIDIDNGQITNWQINKHQLQEWIDSSTGDKE